MSTALGSSESKPNLGFLGRPAEAEVGVGTGCGELEGQNALGSPWQASLSCSFSSPKEQEVLGISHTEAWS